MKSNYHVKKTRFSVIFGILPILCITFCVSCGNGQPSDRADSAFQKKIEGLENATLLKQLDDCAFYLSTEESPDYGRVENNLIVRYTPSSHKFDTLFNFDVLCHKYERCGFVRVIDYKVVEQGALLFAEFERYRAVYLLCIPTGEILDVVIDCGNVTFADSYMSTYRYFDVNDDYVCAADYESDSVYFRIEYSDLSKRNFSKTMASKNEQYSEYEIAAERNWANKHVKKEDSGGGLDWLKGQWVNCFDIVEINMECMFMVVGKTSGEVVYQGRFTIENGQIVYERQNGYCSTLDIDNNNKRIGDSRAGVWFSKRR